MKIAIIGHSASGKSTLAKILAEHYKIPLLYMDTVQFYGDFKSRPLEKQKELTNNFLDSNDNWVIDGNYYAVDERRFRMCDEIFYLDYNRFYCLKEAIIRYFKNRKKFRESLGAIEHFDFSFLIWILYDGRKREYISKHLEHFNMCPNKRHHFKTRRALNAYLKENNIGQS